MHRFPSASALIGAQKPDQPVIGLRPHAAGRAARWFLENFPGDVAYAYKANSSVFLLGALYGAGIRHFDVASIPEIEDAATIPGAQLHFMHPVKSRIAIRRAFAEFGVRSFALDSEDELKKIQEETGGCRDLILWVRVAVSAKNSKIPLERKYGIAGAKAARLLVKARQAAKELGITFHVGSQTVTPDAYVTALEEVGKLIAKAGVVLDRLDVGGGFPSIYADERAGAAVGLHARHPRRRGEAADRRALPADVRAGPGAGGGGGVADRARRRAARQRAVHQRRQLRHAVRCRAPGLHLPGAAGRAGRRTRRESAGAVLAVGTDLRHHRLHEGALPAARKIKEGDYIEIGNTGAYGRALAGRFNGYGAFDGGDPAR